MIRQPLTSHRAMTSRMGSLPSPRRRAPLRPAAPRRCGSTEGEVEAAARLLLEVEVLLAGGLELQEVLADALVGLGRSKRLSKAGRLSSKK